MNWHRERYVKLYVREEGSFARLPLVARGLFNEMLKIADSEGRIEAGPLDLVEVAAFRLGATRNDRRALKAAIPLLLEDGCITHDGTYYTLRNFTVAQARSAPTAPRPRHEPTTTEPRLNHERTTNETRNIQKSAEVLTSPRVEERRGEERRGEEKETQMDCSEPPATEPAILTFPCSGPVKAWDLTASKIAEYAESFPGVDVVTVCRKARQWAIDNPKKRKTAARMASWLSSVWIGKAQDYGTRPAARAGLMTRTEANMAALEAVTGWRPE